MTFSGKISLLAAALLLLTGAPRAFAQYADPSDQFLKAYMASRQAEDLEKSGKYEQALTRFRSAGEALDELRRKNPEWQPVVVDYRSKRVKDNILKLEAQLGVESPPSVESFTPPDNSLEGPLPTDPGSVEPSVRVNPQSSYGVQGSGTDLLDELRMKMQQLESQLAASKARERQMQADRLLAIRQLESAQGQLRDKSADLDRAKLSEAEMRTQLQVAEDAAKAAIASSEHALVLEQQVLQFEQELLIARAEREAADEESDSIAAQLASTQGEITGLTAARVAAENERDVALGELEKAKEAQGKMESLIAENETLVKKLEDAEASIKVLSERPTVEALAEIRSQLVQIQSELAATQEENESFQTTIVELRTQLSDANAALENVRMGTGTKTPEQEQLVEENRLLKEIMTRELREQAKRDQVKKLVVEELAKLEVKSTALMENLEYLSQPVYKLADYELALLKASDADLAPVEATPDLSMSIAVPKDVNSLSEPMLPGIEDPSLPPSPQVALDTTPPVSAELEPIAREARDYFNRKEYQQAEKLYEQILAQDPENLYALSNLGVTRFRAGKLKAAELTFEKAIAINPNDSFSHGTLGIVYYRQGRFDDAVNVLTKSIALNPKNAISHNYLGITASQKGWQEAAEKELQSAVALNPNYADAHFNLAVIYATAEPPSKELARKHYEKALELGAERDPTLDALVP